MCQRGAQDTKTRRPDKTPPPPPNDAIKFLCVFFFNCIASTALQPGVRRQLRINQPSSHQHIGPPLEHTYDRPTARAPANPPCRDAINAVVVAVVIVVVVVTHKYHCTRIVNVSSSSSSSRTAIHTNALAHAVSPSSYVYVRVCVRPLARVSACVCVYVFVCSCCDTNHAYTLLVRYR